jgi:hypothetical protein
LGHENEIGNFNTYYEPIGKPGYSHLKNDAERAAYDEVWHKYLFAGLILMLYSPYSRVIKENAPDVCPLPIDVAQMEEQGVEVPEDIKADTAYREFFAILAQYARNGLRELRAVNPITSETAPENITRVSTHNPTHKS